MNDGKSMMLYVFGGPVDGLIVRAHVENGVPIVNTAGTIRSREYNVRQLACDGGIFVRAFVHSSLTDEEATHRYHAVSKRSAIARQGQRSSNPVTVT